MNHEDRRKTKELRTEVLIKTKLERETCWKHTETGGIHEKCALADSQQERGKLKREATENGEDG